ncbi:MAG: structural protein [Cellvibrionaceae bacterium]
MPVRPIERTRDQWQGMAKEQTDERYIQFIDAKYGFRAMTRILRNYQRRGLITLSSMISTWAPDTENHTQSYINFVAKKLNVSPDAEINLVAHLPALLKAISTFENGQAFENHYSDQVINEGIRLA